MPTFERGFASQTRGALWVALALVAFFATASRAEPTTNPDACGLEKIGTGNVRRVIDGRTIQLEAGQQVRLAAIEVPALPLPRESTPQTNAGLAAKAALEGLLIGRSVTLKKLGPDADRYGRIVAHVVVDGQSRSVQQEMLAKGYARVGADVGAKPCAEQLLAIERVARDARAGLWADSSFSVEPAESPAKILSRLGHFALVEGKVLSVRESRGTIYLNFGRRWSRDFTVTVLKRNERMFVSAGLELKKLSGRRILVRGFIEERGGPWIEATRPEQIELTEQRK